MAREHQQPSVPPEFLGGARSEKVTADGALTERTGKDTQPAASPGYVIQRMAGSGAPQPAEQAQVLLQRHPGPHGNHQEPAVAPMLIARAAGTVDATAPAPHQERIQDPQQGLQTLPEIAEELQRLDERHHATVVSPFAAKGRYSTADLAIIEEARSHYFGQRAALEARAAALVPPIPELSEEASTDTSSDVTSTTENGQSDRHAKAKNRLKGDLEALDDPTFEAVKDCIRYKEAELAVQSAYYCPNDSSAEGSCFKEAVRRFRDVDAEIKTKSRGINERKYNKAHTIFKKIFYQYEDFTPFPQESAGDAVARGTLRSVNAFASFKQDFEDISKYKDLAAELRTTNREPGSEGFDLIIDALVVYRAEINGGTEANDSYERAVSRMQKFNPGITEEKIREEVAFAEQLVDKFAQSIHLPPSDNTTADEQIAKRNLALFEITEYLAQLKNSELTNHKNAPLPAKNGSEAAYETRLVTVDLFTGATTEIEVPLDGAKEFGTDKKEDFRIIYQTAENYVVSHPEQLQHTYTRELINGKGIRDSYSLEVDDVVAIHDDQTVKRYTVKITIGVDYLISDYDKDDDKIYWVTESGKDVELPPYVKRPNDKGVTVSYDQDDPTEVITLSEPPQEFKVTSIRLVPKDTHIPERYNLSGKKKRSGETNYTIRGQVDLQTWDPPIIYMSHGKNRRKLKDVLDHLPE